MGCFFEQPKPVNKNLSQQEGKSNNENIITPNINETLKIKKISRNEAIQKDDRIKIENSSIIGSLSLRGALIDDVSFKKHKQNLKNNKNVEFFNPPETENGFYIETGWTSINNKIKVPSKNSMWTVKGNNVLSENQSVVLEWNNGDGIIFKKKLI